LIFKGTEDRDEAIWSDYTGGDEVRTKILGVGQIWLNKNAVMKICDTSLVGIETDDLTVTTSITISIQRQAALQLGNKDVSGGALQVGNPVERSGNIYFVVRLGGPEAEFDTEREGFFGLGVGTINKSGAPDTNWRLMGLYDVKWTHINVVEGFFNHNQIFASSDRKSALMAIGPSDAHEVTLGDRDNAFIRGGGNLIYVASAGDIYPNTGGADGSGMPPHTTAFVGTAATVAGGTTGNYTILASTASIRQHTSVANGTGIVVQNSNFIGNAQGLYNYLGFPPFLSVPASYVSLGKTQKELRIGYIVGDGTSTIVRIPALIPADGSNPEDSFDVGTYGAVVNSDGTLTALTKGF
jgi:hypothetical protein